LCFFFFFFEQHTAYEVPLRLVVSEMFIIDSVVTVHNGQQRFQKANSLIKEINTTSNQLLAIERSFDFEVENSPVEKPTSGSDLL